MARQELNLVGGFYKDPNLHWSAQDVLNWIPVPGEKVGTRTRFQFRDAPGFKPFVRITRQVPDGEGFITVDQGPIRGMRNVEGKLFVVAGTTLYQITNSGVAVPYGTVPGVSRVSMAHNERGSGNQLIVVNESAGYVFDTSSLVYQKITDAGYPGAFIADFVDGYLVQVEPQGRYWLHSDLSQALDYNTFDQYEAEADPDRIVSLHVAFREVLVFGADTTEPFVNEGRAQGTFQRAANTVIQCGCSARHSPRTMDGAVFFLDDKRIVRRMDGYNPIRISTVGIEAALAECSRDEIAASFAVTYEDRGHKIYYLTVPGRFTFGYDVLSGEWHRRSSPGMGRWRLNDLVFWNGKWIGGDFQSGRLYELDWAYSLDACEELERERVTGVLSADQNPITLNEVELLFNAGGKASTCVIFPEQPEPPTLTGSYPDGVVGIANAAFPYVASGGTPPYTFTNRTGNDPAPGIGVMAGTGIVPAGTPTTAGSYEHRPRVTDANGLYADHIDPYSVNSMILALGSPVSPGGTYGVLQISDVTDWGVTRIPVSAYSRMIQIGGDRVLLYGPSNSTYTDDLGLTYSTPISGLGGDSSKRGGCYVQGVVLVAGSASDQNVYRSVDNGGSWTPVDQGKATHNCVAHGDRAVFDTNGIALPGARFMYSDDACATTLIDGSFTGISTNQCLTSFGGKVVMGGKIHTTAYPGIAITEDCIAVTTAQINSIDSTDYVTAACAAEIDGVEIWVFGLNNGKIYWSEDLVTFTQWVETMPDYIYTIAWSGSHFMVGGNSSSYVLTSPDGKVGTQRPCTLDDAVTNIVVVV